MRILEFNSTTSKLSASIIGSRIYIQYTLKFSWLFGFRFVRQRGRGWGEGGSSLRGASSTRTLKSRMRSYSIPHTSKVGTMTESHGQ